MWSKRALHFYTKSDYKNTDRPTENLHQCDSSDAVEEWSFNPQSWSIREE